jgi:hypothetical protein
MVGLQATVFKDRLKSKLNGVVNYETWVPSAKLMAPAAEFFKKYQERAPAEGIDPFGYYFGVIHIFRCWGKRLKAPRVSTTIRLPTTCAAMSSRPSWAT